MDRQLKSYLFSLRSLIFRAFKLEEIFKMIKPYLAFMAGPNEKENLFELVEPIKPYIRGVCALIHDADSFDAGASYLLKVNNELGGGNVIFGPYGRHDASRNRILYETGIKEGEFYVQIDTLERMPLEFAANLSNLCGQMNAINLDVCHFYSKPYVVRFREDMRYQGNPHEALRSDFPMKEFELNTIYGDESKVRVNMRPIKRSNQPKHFVMHYLRYLLLENSNQNLLGIEHHGGQEAFPKLEYLRKFLVRLLKEHNLPRTPEGVIELLSPTLTENTRVVVNGHKQINDFYRLYVLGDESVTDSHAQKDWDNMPKF